MPRGASWGDDNSIVFATSDTASGLLRVSAGGGEPAELTSPDSAKGEANHWSPSILRAGRGVLVTIVALPGTLVYVPAGARSPRSLVWVDRNDGRERPIRAPLRAYAELRLSPDGTRVALAIRDQQNDIWIWHLARATLTPLTHPSVDERPVWTPDGQRIVFASQRAGAFNLFTQADGTGTVEQLTTGGPGRLRGSWHRTGLGLWAPKSRPRRTGMSSGFR